MTVGWVRHFFPFQIKYWFRRKNYFRRENAVVPRRGTAQVLAKYLLGLVTKLSFFNGILLAVLFWYDQRNLRKSKIWKIFNEKYRINLYLECQKRFVDQRPLWGILSYLEFHIDYSCFCNCNTLYIHFAKRSLISPKIKLPSEEF